MSPNIKQLEAFVLVFHLRSVTQTAGRMNLSQSAVSVLLRQFEESMDARLFDRAGRTLTPTPTAISLLPVVERVLREMSSLKRTAGRLRDEVKGRVRFAATAGITAALLPQAVASFSRRHPDIGLVVHDIDQGELLTGLLDDDVDFSIGATPDHELPELYYERLAQYPLVAFQRREPALGSEAEAPIRWADLLAQNVLLSIQTGSGLRELIDRTLAPDALVFEPHHEFRLASTVVSMAAEGLGIGVLPSGTIPSHYKQLLACRQLIEPVIMRDVVVVTRRRSLLAPAVKVFLDALRAAIQSEPQ